MQHKGIEINGQKIAYYESGGRGPSVLFIHGNSQSGQSFRKQLDSPLGERYRLVALDLPGHGRSEPASDPRSMYTLPGCASLIASFVEKLDLKSALIVGWSLGGNILLEAAARLTEARGLMIIGTVPARFPVPFVEAFLLSPNVVPIMFKRDISKEDIDLWMNHLFAPNILDLPVSFREDLLATDGSAREVFGDSVGEGNFKDELEVISSLRIPLAVMSRW